MAQKTEIKTESVTKTEVTEKQKAGEPDVFGIVSISEKTPATPNAFSFWSKDDENIPLEPGRIITAVHPNNKKLRAIGIVDNLYATRDVGSPLDTYYAHGYGNPEQEMATHQDVIRVASVEVVRRTDGKNQPVSGSWRVRFAESEEIEQAYGADVKKDKALLAGFALDANEKPVPIRLDSRFVLGYEGAHVNIAGASGLATKTSYALFLIYSILSYSKSHNEQVAAVAFNVKESDLLRIDRLPQKGWPECYEKLKEKVGPEAQLQKILWDYSKQSGIDPYEYVENKKLFFYAPAKAGNSKETQSVKLHGEKLRPFFYGMADLTHTGDEVSLEVLFDQEDLDEKLGGVLHAVIDYLQSHPGKSFQILIRDLWKEVEHAKGYEVKIGDSKQHKATVIRFLRRIQHAVYHQLQGLVTIDDAEGKPIPIENIKKDELWIIDINRLHDKGQRMTFLSIIDRLSRLLEAKRNGEKFTEFYKGGPKIQLDNFPDKVVVFVDELNKFAPPSSQRVPLRSRIIDITARGRSYGLGLIGAQQLASQVEEQVLANTSTFLVGRSHAVEIKNRPYEWLKQGLKEKASILPKGQMFLWHAVHARPALINFPIPLHQLLEE